MKKFYVLLMAIVSVLVFALTGCSDGGTFEAKTYQTELNAIESVSIQVTDRELNISASEDEQIHIEYFDSEKEYLEINISESNVLTVKLAFNKEWTDFIGTKPVAENRKINIKVPNNLLAKITASTTNENIKVAALSVTDSISLDSNGGNVICEQVNVNNAINLKAKDGNITGTVIGGWDDFAISCKIKKGDCNLPLNKESGEKSFTADCNNGDINIEFVKQ